MCGGRSPVQRASSCSTRKTFGTVNNFTVASTTCTRCRAHGTREFFFEVQLHTPESIELKHTIHGLYQRCRAATDDLTREALETEMLRHANGLPIPCGVLELPAKVVRPPGWKLGIVKPTIS